MSSTDLFSKEKVVDAHERIKPFIHKTPVLESFAINELAGCEIRFKCENFQKIGAFKMRGATNAVLQLNDQQKANGVVTHSSGNHAQALAKAAQSLGIQAYIVMPETAPKVKVAAVKAYGGQITFCPPTLIARETTAQKIIDEKGATFIHPYDNVEVILGQSSCAKEVFEDYKDLDVFICPVGGGGLLAGSILARDYYSPRTTVFAAEPQGADDAFQSFQAKKLIPQTSPNTLADGLLTSLGKLNFPIMLNGAENVLTCDDKEIVAAMRLIWERMKIVIEPSCAAPLAVILKNQALFSRKKVGVVLTGGNVDLGKLPF
ncbi:pyridoxal-phosphate dependent enzyme [Vicingaceae bacterium]|nr:pyridoxal-phosphate dependent enzyme [Vicingaceae bacterium]